MRLVGWLAVAVAAVAGLVWAGWSFALRRPEMAEQIHARAMAAEHADAAAVRPDPDAMRAMACAAGPCVLVEAGGLTFLVGAGSGGPDYLWRRGYLARGIDLVLLPDLGAGSVDGLGALRRLTWLDGRRAPLPVTGPAGVGAVIDGVNVTLLAADRLDAERYRDLGLGPSAAALVAGPPIGAGPFQTIFDSGVVAVQALPVGAGPVPEQVMYRFDVGGRSILVAPCGAREADLVRASIGADHTAIVLPAVHERLNGIGLGAMTEAGRTRFAALQAGRSRGCLTVSEAVDATEVSRASAVLLSPLYPEVDGETSGRVWRGAIPETTRRRVFAGMPGVWINLPETGEFAAELE